MYVSCRQNGCRAGVKPADDAQARRFDGLFSQLLFAACPGSPPLGRGSIADVAAGVLERGARYPPSVTSLRP